MLRLWKSRSVGLTKKDPTVSLRKEAKGLKEAAPPGPRLNFPLLLSSLPCRMAGVMVALRFPEAY